jgi:hypothetical protein
MRNVYRTFEEGGQKVKYQELDSEGQKIIFAKMRDIYRRKRGKWGATDSEVMRFIELMESEGWYFTTDEVFLN